MKLAQLEEDLKALATEVVVDVDAARSAVADRVQRRERALVTATSLALVALIVSGVLVIVRHQTRSLSVSTQVVTGPVQNYHFRISGPGEVVDGIVDLEHHAAHSTRRRSSDGGTEFEAIVANGRFYARGSHTGGVLETGKPFSIFGITLGPTPKPPPLIPGPWTAEPVGGSCCLWEALTGTPLLSEAGDTTAFPLTGTIAALGPHLSTPEKATGTAEIDGVRTIGYEAAVDIAKVAGPIPVRLRAMTVTVWVGPDGVTRRVVTHVLDSDSYVEGPTGAVHSPPDLAVTTDFFDFNAPGVSISPPPDAEPAPTTAP